MGIDPYNLRVSAESRSLLYPHALWMPIKEDAVQAKISPRTLILHSQAGPSMTKLESLHAYINRDDIHIEPTFILDRDGRMAQLVRINVKADCNASANSFATSVETQDLGSATLQTTPWTDAQVEQLAGLAAWMHMHPDINLKLQLLAPPMPWNGEGINGHATYKEWSIYVGKTCPGAARFDQIPTIIERAKRIVFEAFTQPPVPIPPPSNVDLESMDPILVRFYGTTNVFLLSEAGYVHLTPETASRYGAKLPTVPLAQHKQAMQRAAGENFFQPGDWFPYAPERGNPELVKYG